MVLGCSFSAGEELIDEHYVDNYWDFLKYPQEKYDISKHDKMFDIVFSKCGGPKKYDEKCKELAWPATLEKKLNDTEVINHSLSGMGVDAYNFILNNDVSKFTGRNFNKNIKKDILEADILIWQITYEPRIIFTIDDFIVSLSNKRHIKHNLNKQNETVIPKWKKTILTDYYEITFDENQYLKKLNNLLNYVLLYRATLGKHSVVFSFYNNITDNKWNIIDSEYIHVLDKNIGIVDDMINNEELKRKESYQQFGHPTKKVHDLFANRMEKFLKEKGLV